MARRVADTYCKLTFGPLYVSNLCLAYASRNASFRLSQG
jgi:hypothetical protein